jgi:hypothetical protein
MAVAFGRLDDLDEELAARAELLERLSLVLRDHVRERDVVGRVEAERSPGAQSDLRYSTRSSISPSVNSSGAIVDSRR